MWHIADLYDQMSQSRSAIKWFKILNARVPTDPSVFARIGNIYLKDDDEAQAFHYHQARRVALHAPPQPPFPLPPGSGVHTQVPTR